MNKPILIVLDETTLAKGSLQAFLDAFHGFPLIFRRLPDGMLFLLQPPDEKVGNNFLDIVRIEAVQRDFPQRVVPIGVMPATDESVSRHLVVPHAQEGFSETDFHSQLSQEARGFSNDPHDTPFSYGNSTEIKSTAPPGIAVGKLYQGTNQKGPITQCWTKSAQVADNCSTQGQDPSKYPSAAAYWITKQERRADLNKRRPVKQPSSGPAHWS
jgi:hypothetical protein